MAETVQFNIPIKGRFVRGSMTEKRTTDKDNRPIPEDKQRYEFGVAYPKAEFWAWLTGPFWTGTLAKALAGAPQAVQAAHAWFGNGFNGFSMKISDGDAVNVHGQVNDNTKGCFVVNFSSTYAPNCYAGATPETLTQIDTAEVKRGYYVMMSGSVRFNGLNPPNVGIYMNSGAVWLVEKGPEISGGGVNPAAAFAGVTLPPGVGPVDLSGGVGAQFVPGLPGAAPVPAPMAPAASPVPASMPHSVPPTTAAPGSAPALPGVVPYYGAMNPGQPAAAPSLPGLPPLSDDIPF